MNALQLADRIDADVPYDLAEVSAMLRKQDAAIKQLRNATLEEVAVRMEKLGGVWLSFAQADFTSREVRSMKS